MNPDRPVDHRPVPKDALHAFFSLRLDRDDPDLARWESWFMTRGVRYARDEWPDGTVMLYTHRLYGSHWLWCCEIFAGTHAVTAEA